MKWKIFLALNFVLALPAVMVLVLLLIQLFNNAIGFDNYLFPFLFLFGLSMIMINGFLNIFILQRFFPDKLIPPAIKRLNTLSLTLSVLVAVGVLILCIYGASVEFGQDYERKSPGGKSLLLLLSIALVIDIIVLVMQAQLPVLINRNNQERMHSLIDSIGE